MVIGPHFGKKLSAPPDSTSGSRCIEPVSRHCRGTQTRRKPLSASGMAVTEPINLTFSVTLPAGFLCIR